MAKREYGPRRRQLDNVQHIGSRDYELLRKFVTDHGKILPARITGISARQQRTAKRYIRRARVMGLLP